MQAIDRGERAPGNRGTAKAAFVIGVVVIGLGLAFVAFYVVAAVASTMRIGRT